MISFGFNVTGFNAAGFNASVAYAAPVVHGVVASVGGSFSAIASASVVHSSPVSMSFRETLVARLRGASTIQSIVGNAIHPGSIPETHDLGADGPALAYQIISSSKGQTLGGPDGTVSNRVQFSAFSYTQTDVDAIAEALFSLLSGPPDGPWVEGGVEIVSASHQQDIDLPLAPGAGSDQWIYQTVSEYVIRHRLPS